MSWVGCLDTSTALLYNLRPVSIERWIDHSVQVLPVNCQGTEHPRRKKLLGSKGIATRSKDATRGSWPYY